MKNARICSEHFATGYESAPTIFGHELKKAAPATSDNSEFKCIVPRCPSKKKQNPDLSFSRLPSGKKEERAYIKILMDATSENVSLEDFRDPVSTF